MSDGKATRSPWLSDFLAKMVVASGVGYIAGAYTVSRKLTRPTYGRSKATPSNHGLPFESIACHTEDGLRLKGWVVSPSNPHATIALFHGMRDRREFLLSRISFLARAGFRCIAFDHRAHGESQGRRTSFGYHEGRDVEAVLKLVKKEWPLQPRAALGISMGAAALCFGAAEARHCHAIILESLYHDVSSAFNSRIGSHYPPWYRRLAHGTIWVTERRLGIRLQQLAPCDHIGNLAPAAVLLLTGTDDVHAPPTESQKLYNRCRGPRELYLVRGANHRNVFETGGGAYQEKLLEFLRCSLKAWKQTNSSAPQNRISTAA